MFCREYDHSIVDAIARKALNSTPLGHGRCPNRTYENPIKSQRSLFYYKHCARPRGASALPLIIALVAVGVERTSGQLDDGDGPTQTGDCFRERRPITGEAELNGLFAVRDWPINDFRSKLGE